MAKVLSVVAVVFLALAACGGGPCKARSGLYRVVSATRGGTCGTMPEMIVPVDDTTPAGCTGTRTVSADNCDVTLARFACNGAEATGEMHWNAEGTAASGEMQISTGADAGYSSCLGTYNMTYTKL